MSRLSNIISEPQEAQPDQPAAPAPEKTDQSYQQTTLIDLEEGVPEPPTYYECLKVKLLQMTPILNDTRKINL